ncbi:MAG TPA: dihydrofolate reductase family protein [Gemmatimonadales bacterium]|nr:dihydrofolate reductase family protein [Gemmatimonadales bacterium]
MRRIRYQVATSLDGYIADRRGGYDWIVMDPDIDFNAIFAQFDTLLMGRKTYELAVAQGQPEHPGVKTVVFSRTQKPSDHPAVTIVSGDVTETVRALKARPGKDIWLFGGGLLFRSLLELGLVDTVEPAVIPVLLGGGVPFLPETETRASLALRRHTLYPKSGIVLLEYDVAAPVSPRASKSRRRR